MNTYQRYLLEEFADDYNERKMSRRDLLRRAVLIMGSVPAGMAALAVVGCGGDDDDEATASVTPSATTPAASATTASAAASASASATTPAGSATAAPSGEIVTGDISFDGPGSELLGYLARPSGDAIVPGVVIIHENRGLNEHTRDVARRYAEEGFAALAVDLVSRAGGSTEDTAANSGALGSAEIDDLVADVQAYIDHLQGIDGVKAGGVGVTGFCFGGGYAFEAAILGSGVKAAVPYYGTCRLIDQLQETETAVLAIYGANDNRVTPQAEAVRAKLEASGQPFHVQVYPGANHAFFNDTGGNYNPAAAADAWLRTLAWFRAHV